MRDRLREIYKIYKFLTPRIEKDSVKKQKDKA